MHKEGFDKLREECGLFGVYNGDKKFVSTEIYYGLIALQHRGQESCGIAVNLDREITYYKNAGLVNEVFADEKILDKMKGTMGIGHVRYATSGESAPQNAQPLVLRYIKGTLAMAHNGNLINTGELKTEYERTGAIFQTTSDTEIIAYTIARERLNCHSIEQAVSLAMKKLKGAYSLLVMSPQKLIACRDPWGFRPLSIGKRGDTYFFASESCAFDTVEAEFVRDVLPGEVVYIENGEIKSIKDNMGEKQSLCIFEYIYFARPDSVIANQNVSVARGIAGGILAKEHPVEADIVIGVPDSGTCAAMGYAKESKIPYELGFIKNRYIARTFIKPEQSVREAAVKLKLNALKNNIKGKRVIMVDDSIVRGTTSGRIVKLLRDAGAKEVHVRISSPPFLWPCYFGTDIPNRDMLVSASHSTEEIRQMIGADSLGYLSLEALKDIIPNADCGFCNACFSGEYPISVETGNPNEK